MLGKKYFIKSQVFTVISLFLNSSIDLKETYKVTSKAIIVTGISFIQNGPPEIDWYKPVVIKIILNNVIIGNTITT